MPSAPVRFTRAMPRTCHTLVRRARGGPTCHRERDPASPVTKGARMRAMVYRGPYRVRVEEKAEPTREHPNDAVVRLQLGAICGYDLHLYHGMMPDTRVGTTFGHEFIGVVHEVGPSVQDLKVGDRVM